MPACQICNCITGYGNLEDGICKSCYSSNTAEELNKAIKRKILEQETEINMETHDTQAKKPGVVIFTIICNLALLAFASFLWVEENWVSDGEFLIFSGLTILSILNIFVLSKYFSRSLENIPGLIGLYLKRKRIEEESRIKELEKQSNK